MTAVGKPRLEIHCTAHRVTGAPGAQFLFQDAASLVVNAKIYLKIIRHIVENGMISA